MSSIVFQIQSFAIVALIFYGVYHRRQRYKHVKIMKFAIIWDLLLVAQIELNRGAVNKASKALENPMILNIHVSLAISTVLLYGLIYYTGSKVLKGNQTIQKTHKMIGITTIVVRVATLVTSNLI